MSFKHSCDVAAQYAPSSTLLFRNDVFTVSVQSHFFLFNKPHAAVIPKLLAGKPTMERGFMIEFTSADSEILMEWHDLLSRMIVLGKYEEMRELARMGLFPISEVEQNPELMATVKGFRCS